MSKKSGGKFQVAHPEVELLRLQDIQLQERHADGEFDYKIDPLVLADFTLLIGDNAQGKTRFLRTMIFLRELFSGRSRRISTTFESTFHFLCPNNEVLEYFLSITPQTDVNNYNETIKRNGRLLFSRGENILFNEIKNENVLNFYIPNNIPALVSITDPGFGSIAAIRSFFQRIAVAHTSFESHSIIFNKDALVPNESGTDLASVLNNWKETFTDRFDQVVRDFTKCFTLVQTVELVDQGMPGKLLALREREIKRQIIQTEWSEGFKRTLWLLTLGNIRFEMDGTSIPPSLIFIDEIENSLDYKTLKYMIGYLRDLTSESQVIVSSHSPLVCDFVPPQDWRVFRRKGSDVRGYQPSELNKDLEKSLDFFERKHWDFYVKHLASVKIHKVK
jgi:predicted ATPase